MDLNPDNPIGFGGNIAKGWDKILLELWHGSPNTAVDPIPFKRAVSRLATVLVQVHIYIYL